MRQEQKARDEFLQDLCVLEKKIQALKDLVGKNPNGVQLRDIASRARKMANNFEGKMKSFQERR